VSLTIQLNSQPLLSQYVHGATRNNGWRFLEEKLKVWLDNHADLVAHYESETKSFENDQVKPQKLVEHESFIKQEPIPEQTATSNEVYFQLRLNLLHQEPKQPMWEPHRRYIPALTASEIAVLQQQDENACLLLNESPSFYGSDSSEIEVEENGVWAIDIFQQRSTMAPEVAYYYQ